MPDDTAPATESFSLTTADGLELEAEASIPTGATVAALLAHPHPLHGGSMRSLVTSELFRTLPGRGVAVVRFNFRGVGSSEGSHGKGVDEKLDLVAGLDALVERAAGLPLVIAGWSFGADVALTVVDPRLAGWFLIAPPLRVVPIESMLAAHDPRPKHLAVPEHDQFRPPESAREATADWTNTTVDAVAGADHFFAGRTAKVADLFSAFATELTAPD